MGLIFNIFWKTIVSILIGYAVGFLGSLLTRFNKYLRQNESLETIAIFLIGMISFDICELLKLSGAISIVVCAFTLGHYGYFNLSGKGKHSTSYLF